MTELITVGGDQDSNDFRAVVLFSLFAGVVPRVTWISLGGAIFLGMYEKVHKVLSS